MNLRAIAMILLVLGYVGFEVNAVRRSQHLFEPLFTFDQFASMDHATRRCGDPGASEREDFDRNFAAVRARAAQEIEATHPEATPEERDAMLSTRGGARESEVDRLIESGGCDDPEVWKLLKLYEQRARLTIRTP